MINDCKIKNDKTTFIYSNEYSYLDILNVIKQSDICITNGAPAFGGNSLNDIISLGKPIFYIGDGRIGSEWTQDYLNQIYKNKEIRDNYIIYIQESDGESIKKINTIMNNPIEIIKKFSEAQKDYNFNNWKEIVKKVL